jgi:DNA-directed RNA polymerase subunit F
MSIISELKLGDLKTTGKSDELAKKAMNNPSMIKELVLSINNEDKGVRMRAVDSVQKISELKPEAIKHYKKEFIKFSTINQKEVRWHLAQIYPVLDLNHHEREGILNKLQEWIKTDESNIVKVFSMQAIYDFSLKDESIKHVAKKVIKEAMKFNTPSINSRAKKLLKKL